MHDHIPVLVLTLEIVKRRPSPAPGFVKHSSVSALNSSTSTDDHNTKPLNSSHRGSRTNEWIKRAQLIHPPSSHTDSWSWERRIDTVQVTKISGKGPVRFKEVVFTGHNCVWSSVKRRERQIICDRSHRSPKSGSHVVSDVTWHHSQEELRWVQQVWCSESRFSVCISDMMLLILDLNEGQPAEQVVSGNDDMPADKHIVQVGQSDMQDELLTGGTHLVQGCCKSRGLCQWGLQRQGAGEGVGVQGESLQRG